MIKFYLKKAFCDGWDNVLQLLVPNLICVLLSVGVYMAVSLVAMNFPENNVFPFVALALLSPVVMIFVFAWGKNAASIANFESSSIKRFFASIPKAIAPGFLYGLILSFLAFAGFFSIPYYWRLFRTGNWVGILVAALIVWFLLISFIALQWFIPLYFLQDYNGFKKSLKKCFIIFFDNPFFSAFVFFYNIFVAACSIVLVFLLPGFMGILLSQTDALKLRLYKYDWWEENPEIASDPNKRYEIPWQELLHDDIETLGPRKFRSFLFPWT